MAKERIIIGIDPDLDKSGVACWDSSLNRFFSINTLKLWDLFNFLIKFEENFWDGEYIILIEDSRIKKGTWHKHGQQNVGKGKAICKLLDDFCKEKGLNYRMIDTAGYSAIFENVDVFKRNTGWTERTNKDSRSAAAIVWKNK